MTSKLTREERVQSLYDLKTGQVLNPSDIENIKMLARMALAVIDAKPIGWTDEDELRDVEQMGIGYLFKLDAAPGFDPRRQILLIKAPEVGV